VNPPSNRKNSAGNPPPKVCAPVLDPTLGGRAAATPLLLPGKAAHMAKALRERVGKQYTGTQRTRQAVHGECTVELAKWTFPIISLCREPYEAKVSRTGLTGGLGRRTVW
jgi:hypothetical protein